ncbi:MAG TPA: hypothetical protein PLP73_03945, partial [Candidatus Absconditabacterales bacterium]|nr:hypothetical protein [Candidatus Absconditabacterales bacterium]
MITPDEIIKCIENMKTVENKDAEKIKSDNVAWAPVQSQPSTQLNNDVKTNNVIPQKVTKELLTEYL